MPVEELTQNTIAVSIASHHLVLVEFYTERCRVCKRLAPVLEELSQNHPNIKIYRINSEQQSQASMFYRISSVPTVLVYKDGEQVSQFSGYKTKEEVEEMLSKI